MDTSPEYAHRVARALIGVIDKARWDARIGSLRELSRKADMTHTALNKRMTGQVIFNVRDLVALSAPLGVSASELLRRAQDVVAGGHDLDFEERSDRDRSLDHLRGLPSAAAPERRDTGEGDDHA